MAGEEDAVETGEEEMIVQDGTTGQENSQNSQTSQEETTAPENSQQPTATTKKKGRPPAAQHPCLCCGDNVGAKQAAVRCIMCQLWAHKTCMKMPDELYKSLAEQQKNTRSAYWVCRPCQTFGVRMQHQFAELNKRHDATERRVDQNTGKLQEHSDNIEELRSEMQRMAEKMNQQKDEVGDQLYEEMQEREVRRMNLILHGVPEPTAAGNQERLEKDKEKCDEIFKAMRASTKKDSIRFCRRIGEKGEYPRPMVIGLGNEAEKRHLLAKARDLQHTTYRDVSIVPDLTKKQRQMEANLKVEAEERNKT